MSYHAIIYSFDRLFCRKQWQTSEPGSFGREQSLITRDNSKTEMSRGTPWGFKTIIQKFEKHDKFQTWNKQLDPKIVPPPNSSPSSSQCPQGLKLLQGRSALSLGLEHLNLVNFLVPQSITSFLRTGTGPYSHTSFPRQSRAEAAAQPQSAALGAGGGAEGGAEGAGAAGGEGVGFVEGGGRRGRWGVEEWLKPAFFWGIIT